MSKKLLIVAIISTLLISCRLLNWSGEVGNVKSFSSSDDEMNAAIQQARETLPLFIEELHNPTPTQTLFSIKARIPADVIGGAEHLWVDNVTYIDNQFTGVLGNEPFYVTGYHVGDTMVVNVQDVSDWMIIDENRLIGAFTMHVFLNHMTEREISEFASETGYVLSEDPLLP